MVKRYGLKLVSAHKVPEESNNTKYFYRKNCSGETLGKYKTRIKKTIFR